MKEKVKIFIEGMDLGNGGKVFVGLLLIASGALMIWFPDTAGFIKNLIGAVVSFSGAVGVDLTALIGVDLDGPTIILAGLGVFNIGLAHKALKGWRHLRTVMNGPSPTVVLDEARKGQRP